MTATPDTQQTEQDELDAMLLEAIATQTNQHVAECVAEILAAPLAAIRRQAAADALREQARSLGKTGRFMREQASAAGAKGRLDSHAVYAAQADAYHGSAGRLRDAADGIIAEGYEHTCAASFAATWSDPGYGCETRVPDAGDYCPKHEPEDDEDRWAE